MLKLAAKSQIKLSLSLVFFLATAASAGTRLPIVDYGKALSHSKIKTSTILESLVSEGEVETPNEAYEAPYENIYLQNRNFIICYESCDSNKNVVPVKGPGGKYAIQLPAESSEKERLIALKQTNVYYWLEQLFNRFEKLGFRPDHRLIVRIDQDFIEPTMGGDFHNNAFFNSADWSLNFLTSKTPFLVKLLGTKFQDPSLDASVIMHEAGHSVVQHFIENSMNGIGGMNEGLADYFSLSILNTPELGVIMTSGKPIRTNKEIIKLDPKSEKVESHDLGNIVASVLWAARVRSADKDAVDRVVFDALRAMQTHPYVDSRDFRFLLDDVAKERDPDAASSGDLWEKAGFDPKEAPIVLHPEEVRGAPYGGSSWSIEVKSTNDQFLVEQYAQPKSQNLEFNVLNGALNSPSNEAVVWRAVSVTYSDRSMAPVWIALRKSDQKILGAADLSGSPIANAAHPQFETVTTFSSATSFVESWNVSKGSEWVSLPEKIAKVLKYSKKTETRPTYVRINNEIFPAEIESRTLKPRFWFNVLGLLLGKSIRSMLRPYHSVDLYTIRDPSDPALQRLTKVDEHRRLVGYRIRKFGGEITVWLKQISE